MEEFIKEDKESIEDVGEGEPEEGEIMDDEEEKNQIIIKKEEKQQKEIKQKISESEKIKENKESSPNHSSLQSSEQQIKPEFQRGSSSWRKSFGFAGSHHGGSGRGSIGNSRFSRGGNDSNARYRDFDGRVAMRNNDQQEEEMLDSWNACIRGGIHNPHHYSSRRGGRMNSPSVGGGDISPIRTFPMIEEDEEKDFGKSSEQLPLKKQTEIAVNQQQQIDDDKDFRGIDSNTIESNNPSPQNKQSPHHQHYSDDNDFRRSSIQQSHFNRQTSPSPGFPEERQFEGNKRRHRSQSPPVNISARSQFTHELEDFDTPYGNAAKRYRPFYGSGGPPGGDGFTQKDENFDNFPSFDENGPWSSRPHRGGGEGDFPPQFNYGGDRGGRGGRTQGWGYRGGRPFFPRLICKFFREGFCRDGDQCTFSHLTGDSHRRPELCRYYQQGYCKKGLFCQLMHGEWPCKAFHKGECSKEQCSFSHEPLDDVSRPIMDKILEEEKLGLTRPPQQQHQRFDVPQQQTPHMGRGIRPFFRPRFQGPYHDQIGGQNFSQSQGPQAPQRQFHRNPHQQIGLGAPQPPQQQQQQPFFKKQQHSMNESSVPGHPLSPENLNQGSSEINMLNEETGGISLQQQQPSIPPPGLVMPPPLGGGSPLPLPSSSSSSATFGFFNPVSTQTTPSNQPPQNIQSQPPPSFQQLQQQVHQVAGPHFPHQPSLLGPSSAAAQAQAMLTAILHQSQQTGSTSAKRDFRDNSLQRSPPPPPPKKKEIPKSNIEDQQQLNTKTEMEEIELKPAINTGGFNINQMLEQITKQNSPPPPPQPPIAITNVKREEANTLDLLANVELSDSTTTIIEESPASPIFASEQQQENENKPAALIPVVREWKLHLVDLSPLIECSDMHFDIKLVQQISSSNSDPRLRKIAEKQFDLVSKTLEQQQANQQKNNFNEGIFTPTEQIKK
uniref:C3H1-type domain-containing protein n=3 Tax=Meloidogyne TaxID=189290 RepID=A0A914LKW2_MELIC